MTRKFIPLLFCLLALPAWSADSPDLSAEEIATGYYAPIAEDGEPYAQLAIGEIYYKGEDLPQDLIKAFAWLSASSAQGVQEAHDLLQEVRKEMTPDQLKEAEVWAKQFIEAYASPL